MRTNALAQVRRLFTNPAAPRSTNRHNQRAWVRAVRQLGDKWVLRNPIQKGDRT